MLFYHFNLADKALSLTVLCKLISSTFMWCLICFVLSFKIKVTIFSQRKGSRFLILCSQSQNLTHTLLYPPTF